MIDLHSFLIVMPEIEIFIVALVSLMAAAFCGVRVTRHIGFIAIGAFALAMATMFSGVRLGVLQNGAIPIFAFDGQFVDDSFARFAKALVLGAASLSILLSWSYFEKSGQERPEYPVLIMFATLGMMLMISASNFLILYVGMELQSLSLYILSAFKRDDVRSSEAGVKYFVLGALASCLLLYGISLIYGFSGGIDFVAVSSSLRNMEPLHPGAIVGMVFVISALVFKVSGVPFHMWTPDVYEGAPTPVTAFFASAPKLAAFALLTRFLMLAAQGLTPEWHPIIAFISVSSMLWGAFAGLVQKNLKRLLAYSSIANVGYLLLALLIGGRAGIQAILIYSSIYALNTLGAFAVLLCLRRNRKSVDSLDDLTGLSKTNPVIAMAMAIFMFSLAGVPPLAGFFGKYVVFLGAVKSGFLPLAVVGVLTSVVTAFYYLRLVKNMYFDAPNLVIDPLPDWGVRTVIGISALSMVLFAFVPSPLITAAFNAAKGFIG